MDGNPKKPTPEISPPDVESPSPLTGPEVSPPDEAGEPLVRPLEIDIPEEGGADADLPTRPEIEMPDPAGIPDPGGAPDRPTPTEPFPP